MSNIVFISASPKMNREESSSSLLAQMAGNVLKGPGITHTFIDVRQSITKNQTHKDFEILAKADVVIIVFPLYIFCLPGILMRFLEDYSHYDVEHNNSRSPKIYAVVNCGFPEPGINLEAVRVIKSFSRHIHAHFRFGILIGGGGMLLEAKDASFMKKNFRHLNQAFSKIARDLQNDNLEEAENINISMNFPRWLYLFLGNRNWLSLARKNGLKKKDLYRKPYEPGT